MKARPWLYCDTSFWRRLDDRENPHLRRSTRQFLDRVGRQSKLLISKLVLRELEEVPFQDVRRRALRKVRDNHARVVTTTPRVHRIVRELLEAGCLSERHLEDLYHIAYAVVRGAQYLVTWDQGDLARPWTQRRVRRYCLGQGRHEVVIDTPIEVGRWLDVAIR
jgi:predicted nucleic acid-binding protein